MMPVRPRGPTPSWLRLGWLAWLTLTLCGSVGCSIGPRSLAHSRLRYNDAVKTTSEQQLLLNIVRLRYTDTPSSLSISSIADQQELAAGLGIVPFFTSAAAGDLGTYRGMALPSATLSGISRPTLSYTPLDDEQFTRRLFTPVSLNGVAYLSRTTWPISTVFRLYLENMNWVPNAETASGPTPEEPPEYAEFLAGIRALQSLQDRKRVTLFKEERSSLVARGLPATDHSAERAIQAAHEELELAKSEDGVQLVKKEQHPVLRVADDVGDDPDWIAFCRAFRLDTDCRTFELTSDKLDPYLKDAPRNGLKQLDLETRSLLQVMFFLSQGVEVPSPHLEAGIAPHTQGDGDTLFDWQPVLGDLFQIHSTGAKSPPACAHVAVCYKDHWFYIDERDRQTKATFALLIEVSRLEVEGTTSKSPILTLPIGG